MMKKIITSISILSLILIMFMPLTTVNAKSKTLQDYKDEVAKLQSQKQENDRLTTSTQNSIDAKRNAILNANNTITINEQKVEESKTLVAESQEEIKIKTEELKDVINILQYTDINSDEVYMDYLFDSQSLEELMERQAIIEQVVEYTQEQLDGLNKLIKDNENLQVQLVNDNEALNQSITSYEKQVEELEAYIEKLATIGLDYNEQIKAQQAQIKMFEDAGCKNTDSVDDCYYNKKIASGAFSRPLNYGVVTQAWGNNGHKGMDIGGNKKGTAVYAPANGTVAYTAYHQKCGGNIIYMHFNVGGKAYTGEFAHLTAINVKNGQYVTKGTIIGTVGGDSSTWYYDKCTTGPHLHYAIAYGYYLGSGSNGYSSWSTFTSNTKATSVQSITGIKNQKGFKFTTRG